MSISMKSYFPLTRHKGVVLAGCCVLSVILMIGALMLGASGIPPAEVMRWLGGSSASATRDILLYVRIPRILAAYLCGASLALSGLLLQSCLNNVLASPGTIGVNAGAGLMVVVSAIVVPSFFAARMIGAFAGAILASMLVYAIAKRTGSSRITIIMAGVAVSSLLTAGIDAIVTFRPDSLMDKTAFYIGGFGGVTSLPVLRVLPLVLLGVVGAFLLSSRLNVMLLGDEVAASLGLHVTRCRFLCILCASLLAASAVCVGGLLGFVGLIVPHAVRFLAGMDYRWLVPYTAVCGGMFLLLCDTVARCVFAPFEIPVGIILSFLGAPFFLFLLLSRRRRISL